MKKACLENGEFHIRNICMKDYQTINNDEVLIEVKYASICGSDRSTVKNIDSTNKKDLILGHEYSGVVIKTGKNVPSSVVGKFYNIQPNIHCETCIDCKKKNYSLCKNKLSYGVNLPGGYSQLSVVKFNNIVEIGDLNTKYSSVLEPISCCIRAIDRCGLHNTNNVLILGSGFTGLLMIKIIKSLKSSIDIDVIELCSFKKEVAKNNHARFTCDNIEKLNNSYDLIIDTTGNSKIIEKSFLKLNKGSTFLFFGVCAPKDNIFISPFKFWEKEIRFISSRSNGHCHKKAIQFMKDNDISDLITHDLTLDDFFEFENISKKKNFIKGIVKYEQ